MEPISERLRRLREKTGQDAEGLADQIGITVGWYEDLEKEPGELEAGLDLSQIRKLALLLEVGTAYLVTGEAAAASGPALTFQEFALRIRRQMESLSLNALEERTGWELSAFLRNPDEDGWNRHIPFFREVGAELGVDWIGILRHCDSWSGE